MKDYSFKGPRIYCPISPREKGSFWYDRSAFLLLILICGPLTEKGTNHSLYSYICLVALFHSILVPLWQLWNDHKKDFFKRVKSLRKIISLKRKEREGKLFSYLYYRNWSTCIDHRPLCRICKLRRLCKRQLEEFRPPVHPRWPCKRKRSALNYFLASKQEMEEIMKYMDG